MERQEEGREDFVNNAAYYADNGVDGLFGAEVTAIDPAKHLLADDRGHTIRYERLLLATGGTPHRLDIPGADSPRVIYYLDRGVVRGA